MKTTIKTIAAFAVLTVFGLSSSIQAQSVTEAAEIKSMPAGSTSESKVVKSQAMSEAFIAQVANLEAAAVEAVSSISKEQLLAGGAKVTFKSADARKLVEEEVVNVKVSFDERPIGGILSVQVSMTPSFRGVGVSTRPTVSRSVAMAVDQLDDHTVQMLVAELSQQIQEEYIYNQSAPMELSSVK
jgi:hypothetical protein